MQTHIRSTFDSDKTNSDAWVTEGGTRSTALRPASALPSPPLPGGRQPHTPPWTSRSPRGLRFWLHFTLRGATVQRHVAGGRRGAVLRGTPSASCAAPLCVRRWVRGSPSRVRPRSRTRTPHFPIALLPLPGLTLGSGTARAMTTRAPRPPSACARLARRRVPHRGVPHRGEGTSGRFPLVRTASVRVRAHQLWASVVRCRLPFY